MLTTDDLRQTILKSVSPSITTYKQKLLLDNLVRQEACVDGKVYDIYEEGDTISVIIRSIRDYYTSFTKCIVSKDSQLRFLDKGDCAEVKGLIVSVKIDMHEHYKVPHITIDCRFSDNG